MVVMSLLLIACSRKTATVFMLSNSKCLLTDLIKYSNCSDYSHISWGDLQLCKTHFAVQKCLCVFKVTVLWLNSYYLQRTGVLFMFSSEPVCDGEWCLALFQREILQRGQLSELPVGGGWTQMRRKPGMTCYKLRKTTTLRSDERIVRGMAC